MPTQSQYNVCKQPIRNQTIKINLLDFNMQVVDELSGNCIGGSVKIDSNADIRRTCNIDLVVTDSSFNIQSGSKIWLNRYIQVYLGIDEIATGEIVWFNYGIYLIDAPSWTYDSTNNTLSFQGLDLMSKLTGIRNGYLEGIPTSIPQDSNVRDSIIATLTQLGGFSQYIVDDCELSDGTVQSVPYDIEIGQGGTVYDVLKELRDILPYYEMFFDADGVFIYQQIPTGDNEGIIANDDVFIPNVLSEKINTDFSSVKNVIEVYGKSHDVDNYSSTTTISNNKIKCTISTITTPAEGNMIGFTTPSAVSGNITINVNSKGAKNLVNSSGNFITSLDSDTYYVAYYQSDGTWLFLGHQQAYAISYDDNPDSPFYTGGDVGEIRSVKYGGEYENIQSDELALARAEFEIYQACRLNDTITLSSVPIHWLDVNQIMEYTSGTNNETNQYLIKALSVSLGESGTQSIEASKYYPYSAPIEYSSFSDATWEEIDYVANTLGIATEVYNVGDTKIDENGIEFEIADFYHDALADGSGYAPISLLMTGLTTASYAINSSNTNVGGWAVCEFNLNTIPAIKTTLFSSELIDVVKPVIKISDIGNSSNVVQNVSNTFWIPSQMEVFGEATDTNYSTAQDGTLYPIFSDATSRIKDSSTWRMRTTRESNDTAFLCVNANGVLDRGGASNEYRMCIGCCI